MNFIGFSLPHEDVGRRARRSTSSAVIFAGYCAGERRRAVWPNAICSSARSRGTANGGLRGMATTLTRCRQPLATRETASRSPDCAPSLRLAIPIFCGVCAESLVQSISLDAVSTTHDPCRSSRPPPAVPRDARRRRERDEVSLVASVRPSRLGLLTDKSSGGQGGDPEGVQRMCRRARFDRRAESEPREIPCRDRRAATHGVRCRAFNTMASSA